MNPTDLYKHGGSVPTASAYDSDPRWDSHSRHMEAPTLVVKKKKK